MSVILCKDEQVKHPYYVETLGVHLYSSQELCYALYHNPILVMEGFIGEPLLQFIREELGMGLTALKMERWLRAGEAPEELVFLFLQECDYYTAAELSRYRQKIGNLRKLPPLEYAKKKADYLFEFKQYGRAIQEYDRILEEEVHYRQDNAFCGRVYYNLGVCRARNFQFDKAIAAFDQAYSRLKDGTILRDLYFLTRLDEKLSLKERYLSLITEEQKNRWDQEFEEIQKKTLNARALKELEKLFEKDPIRRMEGMQKLVDIWKQEYRAMV